MQLLDLVREQSNLVQVEANYIAHSVREIDRFVIYHASDGLEMGGALSHDQPELREVTTQGVNQLGPLADKGLMGSEGDRASLMLGALYSNVMQIRTQCRFGNRCCVRRIVFLAPDERLHVDRRYQANLMAKALSKPPPKMASRAGFHRHDARHLVA